MASGGVQVASKVVSKKGAISVLIFGPDFHEFPGPQGGRPKGFKWHLKSCSLLLVSGVLLARARGSKIDPILVQHRGQKPPRSRPDGFESCLQYGCDFSANFESFFRAVVVMTCVILSVSYFQAV